MQARAPDELLLRFTTAIRRHMLMAAAPEQSGGSLKKCSTVEALSAPAGTAARAEDLDVRF